MTKEKIKVCFLINSLKAGGAERVVSTLCNNLNNDFEIHVMLLDGVIEFSMPTNIKIENLNQSNSENLIMKYIKLLVLAKKYNTYCKLQKIQVSFSFLTRSNYINVLSKIFNAKYKVIISERTYLSEYFSTLSKLQEKIGVFLTKSIYKYADFLTTNSARSLINLQKEFKIGIPSCVIENPLDVHLIIEKSNQKINFIFENDIFYFIHIGRLRIEKNHELLINAIAKIKTHKNIKLLLLGEGPEESNIKKYIEKKSLKEKIILLGNQKNPFPFIVKSNCLVLSSNFEGLPNVLLESLACKTPIISTDCNSGPREILAPNTDCRKIIKNNIEFAEYGMLTPVGNLDLLTNAMEFALDNDTWILDQKKKLHYRAIDFSVEKVIKKVKGIINYNIKFNSNEI